MKKKKLLMIGFYQVENIASKTLFNSIKNALGQIEVQLMNFKVQCCHGASYMVGDKTGVAARINEIVSGAHGHTLYLALGDTIKAIKIMRDTLDAAFEFNNKLIKYSIF